MICPFCGAKNIEGMDNCEQCKHSLAEAHFQRPATAVERSLLKDRVRDLAPKVPIVVAPDTPIAQVLDNMVENDIGCVFVVDGQGTIVGVFSEKDAIRRLGNDIKQFHDQPISEFMTPRVNCLDSSAKIAFAVQMMDQYGHRHIPVVNDQRDFEGVVSARDILRFLRDAMQESPI
jgi:CBS domain-containing protein